MAPGVCKKQTKLSMHVTPTSSMQSLLRIARALCHNKSNLEAHKYYRVSDWREMYTQQQKNDLDCYVLATISRGHPIKPTTFLLWLSKRYAIASCHTKLIRVYSQYAPYGVTVQLCV